jgi:hypothetical protein
VIFEFFDTALCPYFLQIVSFKPDLSAKRDHMEKKRKKRANLLIQSSLGAWD